MSLTRDLTTLAGDLGLSAGEAEALHNRLLVLVPKSSPALDITSVIGDLEACATALEQRSDTMTQAASAIATQASSLALEAGELRQIAKDLKTADAISRPYGPVEVLANEAAAAGDLAADLRSYSTQLFGWRDKLPRQAPDARPNPVIWSRAPSGLPFWFGGFKDLDALSRLIDGTPVGKGGALDIVMDYDPAAPTPDRAASNTIAQWSNSVALRYITTGKAKSFVWTAHPWSGGLNHKYPLDWPESGKPIVETYGMCPNRPPTYTGNETAAQRREKQLRVWGYGADGWMDAVWRKRMIDMKRSFFNRFGFQDKPLVLRAAHELDLNPSWGDLKSPRCNSMAFLTTEGDMAVVREALRRFNELFLTIFGQAQGEVAGDVAYPVDNLWTFFNPVHEHFMPVDSLLACPENAYIVGPDVYDRWPASLTQAQFDANARNQRVASASSPRGRRGLVNWLDWCKGNGRLMALGEFGMWSETFAADGVSRPTHEGWDNPAYLPALMELLKKNAQHVAFALYFNSDIAKSLDMPGHRIDSWDGIDDPAVACERMPLGDNNRCAARSLRTWLKAQAPA